jgi:RNA polymerase sigma-70 factor (ECF subfamily)
MTQITETNGIESRELGWIDDTLAGNTRSFDNIIIKYQDQIYNLVLRTIGNEADSQDLAQNVFLNAFQNLKHFRKESSLGTWLYSIAINQIRNYWRSKKYQSAYAESEIKALMEASEIISHEDFEASADYQSEETKRVVDGLISFLPPLQKEIFVLYYILGHSCEEVSKILHTSSANVKIQLFRGRDRLFKRFKHLFK